MSILTYYQHAGTNSLANSLSSVSGGYCDEHAISPAEGGFRVGSYGLIAWAYRGVKSKMEVDDRFRKMVVDIQRRIGQQKI